MKPISRFEFEELVGDMKIHSIRVPDHKTVVKGLLSGKPVQVVFDHLEDSGYVAQDDEATPV